MRWGWLVFVAACHRTPPSPAPVPVATMSAAPLVVDAAAVASEVAVDPGTSADIASPAVHIAPAGPALILVTSTEKTIEIERHVVGEDAKQKQIINGKSLHAAKPATSYAYRARVPKGPWSEEVSMRTPLAAVAPPVPTTLTARAKDPYTVELTWTADARTSVGFEIGVLRAGDWQLVAVVNPTETSFTHAFRMPKAEYLYRVRSFNDAGASMPLVGEKLTMPETDDAPVPKGLAGCTKLGPENPKAMGMPRGELSAEPKLYNEPENRPLRRHLIGDYRGCLRDLGTFELQADVMVVTPEYRDEGFPILHAVASAGEYVGATLLTLRFKNGHYREVNNAYFCGEPGPELDRTDPTIGDEGSRGTLAGWHPPFPQCQRDSD